MATVSLNKVLLIGNLGRDPEVRETPSGRTVAQFPLATHRTWLDTQGERQQHTDWHTIVVWGQQAAACGHYLTIGRLVSVEGEIRSHSYDTPDGEKRFSVEILARRVQFLDSRTKADEGDLSGLEDGETVVLPEEDIPF